MAEAAPGLHTVQAAGFATPDAHRLRAASRAAAPRPWATGLLRRLNPPAR